MDGGGERSEIVRTIVTLARNLGWTSSPEGVETAEQVTRLRALGCDYGQGYFFSKPLATAAAAGLIQGGVELGEAKSGRLRARS